VATDPFRSAFVRLSTEHGLYREATLAVTFLTPTLFRTGIPLPAEMPIGIYDIEIKLFVDRADGKERDRLRHRQGRLRTVRDQCGAQSRLRLRPAQGGHFADDRLGMASVIFRRD
jgi:hypothetical protein